MSKLLTPLRIGAFNRQFIVKVINKGGNGVNCRLGYVVGQSINDLIRYGAFNCTIVQVNEKEGRGTLNDSTGRYNGLSGLVQQGQVDAALNYFKYPMMKDDFFYSPLARITRITVLSSYTKHDHEKDEVSDIGHTFDEVQGITWASAALFLILFVSLLYLTKRLILPSVRFRPLWSVVTFATSQGGYLIETARMYNFLLLLLSFLVFWWSLYFCNLMITQLIRPSLPLIIDSFGDLLSYRINEEEEGAYEDTRESDEYYHMPRITVHFIQGTGEMDFFERADEQSDERAVYQQAIEMSGTREAAEVDVATALTLSKSIFEGKIALVASETIIRLVRTTYCSVTHDTVGEEAERLYYTARHTSVGQVFAFLYSQSIDSLAREKLNAIVYKFVESGLAIRLQEEVSRAFTSARSHKVNLCLSDVIEPHEDQFMPLHAGHIALIFTYVGIAFALVAFILLLELAHFYLSPSSLRKKRRERRRLVSIAVRAKNNHLPQLDNSVYDCVRKVHIWK